MVTLNLLIGIILGKMTHGPLAFVQIYQLFNAEFSINCAKHIRRLLWRQLMLGEEFPALLSDYNSCSSVG